MPPVTRLRTEHNVKVEWVHFPLHPDLPLREAARWPTCSAGRNVDRQAMHAQMKTRMVGRHGVVGAQPYEALEQLVQQAASPGAAGG